MQQHKKDPDERATKRHMQNWSNETEKQVNKETDRPKTSKVKSPAKNPWHS